MICCVFRDGNKNKTHSLHSERSHHPEKRVMLIFGFIFFTGMFVGALVSLIGTGLTLRPKRGTQRTRREAVADKRQRVILSWLAASDLLGCVGGLVMAVYGIIQLTTFYEEPQANPDTFAPSLICVVLTTWMQFFYVATIFWSFFYALDVYLMLKGHEGKFLFWVYFCLAWFVAAVVMGETLYLTFEKRKGFRCVKDNFENMASIFIGPFVVLIIMFFGMPVIYFLSSRMLSPMLKRGGVYTNRERRVKAQIQKRFFKIVVIFMICWSPNIIEYFLALIQLRTPNFHWWDSVITYVLLSSLMAFLNPMQAFLNALVYWGPAGCTKVQPTPEVEIHHQSESFFIGQRSATINNGEEAPLLGDTRM